MSEDRIYAILKEHVPEAALLYCLQCWRQTPFELKLTKVRNSKVGDFTSHGTRNHPRITLNHDLNPYAFLITYIHEVAHLHVYLKHGNRVEPHGEVWKDAFRSLLLPIMVSTVFPETLLYVLQQHMVNPKASSYADSKLTQALRAFDKHADQYIVLGDLPEGSIFRLQGKFFKKGAVRRTRVVCRELKTKHSYLVPIDALVSHVQLSLL